VRLSMCTMSSMSSEFHGRTWRRPQHIDQALLDCRIDRDRSRTYSSILKPPRRESKRRSRKPWLSKSLCVPLANPHGSDVAPIRDPRQGFVMCVSAHSGLGLDIASCPKSGAGIPGPTYGYRSPARKPERRPLWEEGSPPGFDIT
jgi:hypothetical protein